MSVSVIVFWARPCTLADMLSAAVLSNNGKSGSCQEKLHMTCEPEIVTLFSALSRKCLLTLLCDIHCLLNVRNHIK